MRKLSGKQKQIILLILIILMGAFLRFYKLDFQSLGNDELTSWHRSYKAGGILELVKSQAKSDVNPPGYQIILFYLVHYIGDTEFLLRLPSALAGILSIYLIYLLGVKFFSAKEGLIASVLTAISWCPIYYSQEARAYSLLLLFSILTMYFWIDIVRGRSILNIKSYSLIAVYSITAIITISLHYFGVLLISLQGAGMLLYFVNKKKPMKVFFISYGMIFLAFIPFIPPLLIDFNPSFKTFIKTPDPFIFFKVLMFFFNNSPWFLSLAGVLYLFLLFKFIHDKKMRTPEKNNSNFILLVLVLWFLVPLSISYIISVAFLPVLTERNLIISLPAAFLIFAHSVVQLPASLSLKKMFLVFIVFISLFHLIVKTGYYKKPSKPQFRDAAKYVVDRENDEDAAVVGYCWSGYMFNYYFEKMESGLTVNLIAGGGNDFNSLEQFIEENEPDYFWYIFGHRQPDKQFLHLLHEKFKIPEEIKFKGAGVLLCEIK